MLKPSWTSNDICYDPNSKVILGQVICKGTNDFEVSICTGYKNRFIDKDTAIKQVNSILTTFLNNKEI